MSSSVDGTTTAAAEGGLDAVVRLLDLEALDVDLFRGAVTARPSRRLFGGQVAAQAVVAAERTTDPGTAVHSLHAYFLRPGDTAQAVIFRVDRLQDGRTFSRRRVTAIQQGKPILCLEASFTTDRAATDHQEPAPTAADPEQCHRIRWEPSGSGAQPWDAFDVRIASGRPAHTPPFTDDVWFRADGDTSDGRVSPSALLTYVSDMTLAGALVRGGERTDVTGLTSLDHVMWLHNEVRVDDWLLYVKDCPAVGPLRGLARGAIFARNGTLIASVAQEGLIHSDRPRQ
jgi:acyl-CoA thioesterase-2